MFIELARNISTALNNGQRIIITPVAMVVMKHILRKHWLSKAVSFIAEGAAGESAITLQVDAVLSYLIFVNYITFVALLAS